jgi:hypothetical protein
MDEKPVVTFPAGVTVDMLQGAAPGAPGQTRVRYRARGRADWQSTPWQDVDVSRDFTRQHRLAKLIAATTYEVRIEGRPAAGATVSSTVDGDFRTAPLPGQTATVRFTVITGQNYHDRDLKAADLVAEIGTGSSAPRPATSALCQIPNPPQIP